MSDDDESIGEELEFDDEDSIDEFGQSFEPYSSNTNIISPITKTYRNEKAENPLVTKPPVLARDQSSNSFNKSTGSAMDDYSMDFSEAANETYYSEDFGVEETAGSRVSPHASTQKLSVQFKDTGLSGQQPRAAIGYDTIANTGQGGGSGAPQHHQQFYHQQSYQQQPPPVPYGYGPGSNAYAYGAAAAPPPPPVQQVPTMSIQALQAEVAVEQLSKEVVKLRNQHRNVLRQRRAVIESKKSRAEERRATYTAEMQGLKDALASAQAANATQQQQIVSLNAEVAALIENRDVVKATVARLEGTISTQNATSTNLQAAIESLEEKQKVRQADWERRRDEWEEEKEGFLIEIEKLKVHNAVAMKSVEASEARLSRARDQLPAFHQARLDEEVTRLQELQAVATDREARIRVDEEKRMAQLEQLRKDLLAEVGASRVQMQAGIDEQRAQLEAQRKEFEAARTRSEVALNTQAAENDATRVMLQQHRHEIETERRELARQQSEHAMSVAMVEPSLTKMEKDKARTEEMKAQAQSVLDRVTEQARELLSVERQLVEREKEGNRLSSELASSLEQINTKIHQAQTEDKALAVARKQVQNEKFALHQCMMEMHRQMDILKTAMRQAAHIIPPSQGGSGGALTAVGDGSSRQGAGAEGEKTQDERSVITLSNVPDGVNGQSAMRILFTLEQSSEQLSQLIGQAVAKGSYNAPSHVDYSSCPQRSFYAEADGASSAAAAAPRSSNMMSTYNHCTQISKQLMALGQKQLLSPDSETHALLNKYNSMTAGGANSGGSVIDNAALPFCLHSVLDDISNSTDRLNSIASRYSTSL